MTMDRDHRSAPHAADHSSEDDIARRDADSQAQPAFRYASEDEVMSVAQRMMDRYEDVLRELAK